MLSTHRAFVLGLLLPACVVAKSVGEDPETAGLEPETAEGGSAESSTSTTSGSSSSASASSTQSGGGDDTCSASECGSSEVTGFDPSATSSVEETSATSEAGSSGSTTTGAVDCGYDPPNWDGPGEYNARCICETCEFQFDDISEDDVLALTEDVCDCLCMNRGCGGLVGSSEATTLASTSDVPETDTGDSASTSG